MSPALRGTPPPPRASQTQKVRDNPPGPLTLFGLLILLIFLLICRLHCESSPGLSRLAWDQLLAVLRLLFFLGHAP
jgi:hypothetical protein